MKLTVQNINYKIKDKEILKEVSFSLSDGDILAVLGSNGAGKTSLFEIITGIIMPTSGTVIFDKNNSFTDVKKKVGVLWDEITLFPLLKVREVFKYIASIYGMNECPDFMLECIGIKPYLNSYMNELSKGERRKVEILLSVMHNPNLLILDEPTSSLDPLIRNSVWTNILKSDNRTIMFSTHQWEEAAKFANKIAFINKGKILNNPASAEEIIKGSNISKKIIVGNNTNITSDGICSYPIKDNIVYLIKNGQDDVLMKIREQTMRYSIMDIGLEDIYHLLIFSEK
ncbi:ABC transporter ATP-binding protein [Bacteroidaceae bacterium HV4-6-C5C]|nr:ABC transporter ATP-binding protein [Bacteroidaceae bacterium HV4-6-C5C]